MRYKGRQGKFSLLLLFVGIFAFWWGIAVLAQNDSPASAQINPSVAASDSAAYLPQNISGKVALQVAHTGDVYTYSGALPTPSACDSLGSGIAVQGSDPVHVTVVLTLMKPVVTCSGASSAGEMQPFSVSLSVKPGAKALLDGVTVNGIIMGTTLEEVSSIN